MLGGSLLQLVPCLLTIYQEDIRAVVYKLLKREGGGGGVSFLEKLNFNWRPQIKLKAAEKLIIVRTPMKLHQNLRLLITTELLAVMLEKRADDTKL